MSMKKEKKAKAGKQRPHRSLEAAEKKLRAKLVKKIAKKERSKKKLTRMEAEVVEMESECARMRETKQVIEQTVAIQQSLECMLLALLFGG